MQIPIKRALISVSKKEGLPELARVLARLDVEILSTGNTAEFLKKEKVPVVLISDFTKFPEILDGRVKTLHPKIHGGLLARRQDPKHSKEMEANQIVPIDLVVVNLYPFEETVADGTCTLAQAIEKIDIGGPSMIRSAAKNFESVAVVVDPADYETLIDELNENEGQLSLETRFRLAQKAFVHTAAYDGGISSYLTRVQEPKINETPELAPFPQVLNIQAKLISPLRYGENPHQGAAWYRLKKIDEPCLANAVVLNGKELSFNNLLDLDAALNLVKEFQEAACVIVKHNNPCGVAVGATPLEAFLGARAGDPVSAFGGIVAVNRRIDLEFAQSFNETFFEAIIAPDFDPPALDLLKGKKNLRVLKASIKVGSNRDRLDFKKIVGGLLVQDRDVDPFDIRSCRAVTERTPTPSELTALDFAWRVVKHVKSNAIVYAKQNRTLGIGAGQMSRVDAVCFGALKARESLKGCVLASDAFFPFRDGLEEAAKQGVTAVIQPGGSLRDAEVVQAANAYNIAMVFTGVRHFKH